MAHIAPFRGDLSSIAALDTIDFSRLAIRDPIEVEKLLKLSERDGFFYLDMRNDELRQILVDVQGILRVMEAFFSLPLEEKMKNDRKSTGHG
jgi:isopenicillin N synthase-like dioxygenase